MYKSILGHYAALSHREENGAGVSHPAPAPGGQANAEQRQVEEWWVWVSALQNGFSCEDEEIVAILKRRSARVMQIFDKYQENPQVQ